MRTWSLAQLLGYALETKTTAELVDEYFKSQWIETLDRVTGDGDAMRTIMRTTGAVISGGFALKFLDPGSDYVPGNLNCYVPTQGYHAFLTFLVVSMGADIVSQDDFRRNYGKPHPYRFGNQTGDTGIADRRLLRIGETLLDIVCSNSPSPLLPIAKFHSTAVMNFISAEGFCIAYPISVLQRVAFTAARRMRSNDRAFLQKYHDRGFLVFPSPHSLAKFPCDVSGCYAEGFCAAQRRFFTDQHCITVIFDRFKNELTNDVDGAAVLCRSVGCILPTELTRLTVEWVWGGPACRPSPSEHGCGVDVVPFVHTTALHIEH